MTMNTHNNWSEIPPEIVEEVLEHCDETSLLVLSRVNRQLNTLALSRYFAPKIDSGVLSIGLHMRLLHIAFRLPETIHSIYYDGERGTDSYNQYINDLRDLTSFIHRMPKVKSLTIRYSTYSAEKHNAKAHYEAWERLVEVAISKRCEFLYASEPNLCIGSEAEQLRSSPKPSGFFDLSVLRSRFGLYWRRTFGQDSTCIGKGRGRLLAQLQDVTITGSSLQNGPHSMLHTLLLVTQHATTVTRLFLMDLGTYDVRNAKNWIFEYIHFPALQYFTFMVIDVNGDVEVPPTLLLKFLRRHPHLVRMNLCARFNKGEILERKQWPWAHTPLKFLKLEELEIFPEVLVSLMPDFRSVCPNIRSIHLTGRGWSPNPSPDAIRSILNNLHASASMTSPLEITIWLLFHDKGWMSSLYNIANSGTSPDWSRVKKLSLIEPILNSPFKATDPVPNVLIDWISRFPSLEHLEVYPMTWELRNELGRLLAVRCPRLSPEFNIF